MEQRFLFRLLVGSFILVLICLMFFVTLGWIVREHYELRFNATTLVLGNSHPECAIDDVNFPAIKNLARSAEPLYYTKYKLKWLLNWNPQINVVCVELSENQLESRMKDWIWSDDHMPRQTVSLFPFLNLEHHYKGFRERHFHYIGDLFLAAKRVISGVLLQNEKAFFEHLDWGGFKSHEGSHFNTSKVKSIGQCQEELIPDQDNLDALMDIQRMGLEAGVKIIFIRCPYHSDAPSNFEKSFQYFFQLHPELKLIDYRYFPLDDSCFFDIHHLNIKGAGIFTSHLMRDINQSLN
jgi:hypothetical protein